MINYSKTYSDERPEEVDVKETMVFVASNIKEVLTPDPEGEGPKTQYEFDYVGYTKDEYIKLMTDNNSDMNAQLLDAQLALCELYEMLTAEDELI